jgi:hypothetical protein
VAHRKAQQFETAVAEMAADPAIRRESQAITKEFLAAEGDGLAE